jgi:hypothetical protein
MSSRAAEFASAILIGVLVGVFAGAYLITMPYGEASDCLTEPKGDTAQGQHWYYRIEHGTKRHCWYLKNEGEKTARASTTASRKVDTAPRRSLADARAELRSRSRIEDDTSAVATQAAAPPSPFMSNAVAAAANGAVADDNNAGSNVMSRWPEPTGVSSSAGAAADVSSSSSSPTLVVADALTDSAAAATLTAPITSAPVTSTPVSSDPAATSPMIAAPMSVEPSDTAATNASAGKYSGSLQELLVVAFAALALAGLTGNAVYRLARIRHAKQRYNHARRSKDWQSAKRARKKAPQPKMKPEDFAPAPDFVSNHDFAPRTNFAPRPEYAPRGNFVPTPDVSEYAPKRSFSHAGRQDEDEPADDNFRSIEELLMRLAK